MSCRWRGGRACPRTIRAALRGEGRHRLTVGWWRDLRRMRGAVAISGKRCRDCGVLAAFVWRQPATSCRRRACGAASALNAARCRPLLHGCRPGRHSVSASPHRFTAPPGRGRRFFHALGEGGEVRRGSCAGAVCALRAGREDQVAQARGEAPVCIEGYINCTERMRLPGGVRGRQGARGARPPAAAACLTARSSRRRSSVPRRASRWRRRSTGTPPARRSARA